MAHLKSQFAILAVLGLPVVIATIIFGPTAFDIAFHRRPPERYLIPAGYIGWVRIHYGQSSASPLPIEDGRRLIKFDTNGHAITSSAPLTGHGRDEFFYYSGESRTALSTKGVCKGGMVWDPETVIDSATSTSFARFFIGTEEQYRHEVDPSGKRFPACE